jgi:uncharacterized membrane protein YqjE
VTARPTASHDADVGIPQLVRQLADDSKRLAADEMRLARLELGESVHAGARGAMWLALALGLGVVSIVALTIGLVALIGVVANDHYWLGATIVGAVEAIVGVLLIRRGGSLFSTTDFTFGETRAVLRETMTVRHTGRAD